jgi:hypothetical protein
MQLALSWPFTYLDAKLRGELRAGRRKNYRGNEENRVGSGFASLFLLSDLSVA